MGSLFKVFKYLAVIFVSVYIYHLFSPVKTNEVEIERIKTVYVDCVEVIIDTFEVHIPTKVDTAKVIQDYYTRKHISSEYTDENISIQINDNLFNNSIENRKLNYKILPRADPLKWFVNTQMYIGQHGGGIAVGIGIMKNRKQFSLAYDPINEFIFFGFNYQLKIRSPTKSRGLLKLL